MVLTVLGMEGHTLPWPTPPPAPPLLRMEVATTAMHPTAHGGIVATSALHLPLQHHYWYIHIPIRWCPRCG